MQTAREITGSSRGNGEKGPGINRELTIYPTGFFP